MSVEVEQSGKAGTRPCEPADLPAVARLWLRVFRGEERNPPPGLCDYFAEVFFRSPWRDHALPSLVYEGPDGTVAGFLGVLPRRLELGEREVAVAVGTQFMVDPQRAGGLAALQLLRAFLDGPQDLSLTDGANDSVARLWERLGGEVAWLHCLEWRRTLRPAAELAARLARGRLARAAAPARWAGRGVDAVLAHLPGAPLRPPRPPGEEQVAAPEALLRCLEEAARGRALRPVYDRDSLGWLLRLAGRARSRGELRARLVWTEAGKVAGWYVAHFPRGGVCRALQFGGREVGRVLDHLFREAWRGGAVAVEGPSDPRALRELSDRRCRFACRSLGVLIHARERELTHAIHRGDALLSRLEGEWWLSFGDAAETGREKKKLKIEN